MVDMFFVFSGLNPNLKKSEITGIGALKDVQVAVCGLCCVYLNNDTLKILGTEAFLLEMLLGPAKT